MEISKKKRILALPEESGVLRPRDLKEFGISGAYLNKLYAEGLLERPRRREVQREARTTHPGKPRKILAKVRELHRWN